MALWKHVPGSLNFLIKGEILDVYNTTKSQFLKLHPRPRISKSQRSWFAARGWYWAGGVHLVSGGRTMGGRIPVAVAQREHISPILTKSVVAATSNSDNGGDGGGCT
ncbi:hypothetical protein CTI12_AA256160 [Artemisia annua]|uniref:Uncharacterized protein n=1 Tax=Artemisia annua TaxID=35608 RepID=A0A2U1NKF6_ARTAN|nr:hypothetical protein CTI12_AA256160 [Artemisia annua]